MQVAEVLSDLTSLRVCGPAEALALVRAATSTSTSSAQSSQDYSSTTSAAEESAMRPGAEQEDDPDLRKVYDLMHLHELVKTGYAETDHSDLERAREKVDGVIMRLKDTGR